MSLKHFIISAIIFLAACNNNTTDYTSKSLSATPDVDSIIQTERGKNNSCSWDTIRIDNNIFLIGDSSKHPEKDISYVAVKFKPHNRFNDFPAEVEGNKAKAPINYSSNQIAREYKTLIANTYRDSGLNFGGHYCFVKWGCGSPCHGSALVDLNTGIVYNGVDAPLGFDYKRDSRMLIVNPPDSTGFYWNCAYCEPQIFIWNEQMKKFEER